MGEVADTKASIACIVKLALCPRSTNRRRAKDVEKLLAVGKEGA